MSPSSVTVSGWIKQNESGNYIFLDKGDRYYMGVQNSYPRFSIFLIPSSRGRDDTFNGAALDNNWHNIVGTFDDMSYTMALYVDGQFVKNYQSAFLQGAASYIGSNSLVYIGNYYGNNYYVNALLDDVRMYNRALSASEISNLYKAGAQ